VDDNGQLDLTPYLPAATRSYVVFFARGNALSITSQGIKTSFRIASIDTHEYRMP
jgi:cytolysin (calcineurin-like family phosphatase)